MRRGGRGVKRPRRVVTGGLTPDLLRIDAHAVEDDGVVVEERGDDVREEPARPNVGRHELMQFVAVTVGQRCAQLAAQSLARFFNDGQGFNEDGSRVIVRQRRARQVGKVGAGHRGRSAAVGDAVGGVEPADACHDGVPVLGQETAQELREMAEQVALDVVVQAAELLSLRVRQRDGVRIDAEVVPGVTARGRGQAGGHGKAIRAWGGGGWRNSTIKTECGEVSANGAPLERCAACRRPRRAERTRGAPPTTNSLQLAGGGPDAARA
ncbi:hypothetical protein M2351_005329 [Azospirillum canadense]|nr:hypothetical protein [Azospirillum canadense]